MVALFLPIPILMLGTIVALVQVLVFCLLTSIYISLANRARRVAWRARRRDRPLKRDCAKILRLEFVN